MARLRAAMGGGVRSVEDQLYVGNVDPTASPEDQALAFRVREAVVPQIEASDGVTPAQFPLFLTRSVVWYDTIPSQCCILGYHSVIRTSAGTKLPFEQAVAEVAFFWGVELEENHRSATHPGDWRRLRRGADRRTGALGA